MSEETVKLDETESTPVQNRTAYKVKGADSNESKENMRIFVPIASGAVAGALGGVMASYAWGMSEDGEENTPEEALKSAQEIPSDAAGMENMNELISQNISDKVPISDNGPIVKAYIQGRELILEDSNQDGVYEAAYVRLDDAVSGDSETIDISTGVDDSMAFGKAFSTAREELGEGGAFVWRGNSYSTYYKEEWESMTPEQRENYWTSVEQADESIQKVVTDNNYSYDDPAAENSYEVAYTDDSYNGGESSIESVDINSDGNIDGIAVDINNNGMVDVGAIDSNSDGYMDRVAVDINNDGVVNAEASDSNIDGNIDELAVDINSDGIVDAKASDSNIDGNIDELVVDTNSDGIIDAKASDSNIDGNIDELVVDTNSDDRVDAAVVDSDSDGYMDKIAVDTNSDGVVDAEVVDSNSDGNMDRIAVDINNDGQFDVGIVDIDGNGKIDGVAIDTDGNGEIDSIIADTNNDGKMDEIVTIEPDEEVLDPEPDSYITNYETEEEFDTQEDTHSDDDMYSEEEGNIDAFDYC